MSNTKEYNRANQDKYYKSNSDKVLAQRAMRKIKKHLKLSRQPFLNIIYLIL